MTTRVTVAALAAAAAFGLTSCSPATPFVYRLADGGAVELLWPDGCGHEVEEITVSLRGPARESEDDDLRVWHIRASDEPVPLAEGAAIRVGDAPEGFEVLVELEEPLDPDRAYYGHADVTDARMSIGGRWNLGFTPDELDADWSGELHSC